MEILTILGSPHDPAVSTILAHQLIKGAQAAANHVTIFDAGHHPLAPVKMDADNHLLPGDAVTERLLDQMVAADLIVFATPMFIPTWPTSWAKVLTKSQVGLQQFCQSFQPLSQLITVFCLCQVQNDFIFFSNSLHCPIILSC